MPCSRKRLLSVLLDRAASARAWRQRAGPALVRRGEEIETAAGHVGNLGGAPRALVEFRSGGAAVDVGPDLLGVGARAIVLAGHLLKFPSFGIARVAVNVCSPDTNTIPTKIPTNRTAGI